MKRLGYIMAVLAIITASCEKRELHDYSGVKNQKYLENPCGWKMEILIDIADAEQGLCGYYYRCTPYHDVRVQECNPDNPRTLGGRLYPICDENGNPIRFPCDDVSQSIYPLLYDHTYGWDNMRAYLQSMYDDGLLLISVDEYVGAN